MLPLDSITVVRIEHAVSAPFATRQLADLGARVIKVEHIDTVLSGLAFSPEEIAALRAEAVV
jgi:crotonobetainyl-CoA:carnitine CoA-transferase CaiB-like acyl-CoA transferase